MSINDGGPAYPCPDDYSTEDSRPLYGTKGVMNTGMSLRDHFAGLAMQGMYANPGFTLAVDPARTVEDQIAYFAYKQADAMLAEKERGR